MQVGNHYMRHVGRRRNLVNGGCYCFPQKCIYICFPCTHLKEKKRKGDAYCLWNLANFRQERKTYGLYFYYTPGNMHILYFWEYAYFALSFGLCFLERTKLVYFLSINEIVLLPEFHKKKKVIKKIAISRSFAPSKR